MVAVQFWKDFCIFFRNYQHIANNDWAKNPEMLENSKMHICLVQNNYWINVCKFVKQVVAPAFKESSMSDWAGVLWDWADYCFRVYSVVENSSYLTKHHRLQDKNCLPNMAIQVLCEFLPSCAISCCEVKTNDCQQIFGRTPGTRKYHHCLHNLQ